jgi:16S rRNA (guanine527-N7)-methyltransferase
VDNGSWSALAHEGAKSLGLSVPDGAWTGLKWFSDELLRWNRRVNLTAITEPREVLEKHVLDSLAVLPVLGEARSLLDLGAGAGLPGIPLALARQELQVTLVDAVAKKVGFLKHALAQLGLAGRARGVHARAEGAPMKEGLPVAEVVVSRAFMDVGAWLQLARPYVAPGGCVLAMVSRTEGLDVEALAAQAGCVLAETRAFELPWSRAPRAVLRFVPNG